MSTSVSSNFNVANFNVAKAAIESLQPYDPAKADSLTADLNKDPKRALEIAGIAQRYARLVGPQKTAIAGVHRFYSPLAAAERQLYQMALDPKEGDGRAADVTRVTGLLENLEVAHV